MKKLLIASVALGASMPSIAGLYISPSTDAQISQGDPIYHVVDGPNDRGKGSGIVLYMPEGEGSGVPLSMAMAEIVPPNEGWTVHYERGLEDLPVDWVGSQAWRTVLSDTAKRNGLQVQVNDADKVIGIARTEGLVHHLAQATPQVWYLEKGVSLSKNLREWANQAGWELVWDTRIDYRVANSAVLTGPLRGQGGALERLLMAYLDKSVPLSAEFVRDNRVLRIYEAVANQGM